MIYVIFQYLKIKKTSIDQLEDNIKETREQIKKYKNIENKRINKKIRGTVQQVLETKFERKK